MRVFVMSRAQFNKLMSDNNITDDNVETKGDVMLISIQDSGKPEGFRPTHFKRPHPNVLLMTFDDLERSLEGRTVFDKFMAKKLFYFIKHNRDRKTCVVHCEAGISRSGAVGSFIQGYCGGDWEQFKKDNPHISPNGRVLRMLNQQKYEDQDMKIVKESLNAHIPTFDELYDIVPKEIKDYIDKSANTPQSPKWHPEGNNLIHMKIVYGRARETGDINLAMGAFFHDLGKVDTTAKNNKGDWSAHGHEEVSARLVAKYESWIEEMGANPAEVYNIVKYHMKIKYMHEMRPSKREEFKRQPFFSSIDAFTKFDDMTTLTDEEKIKYK